MFLVISESGSVWPTGLDPGLGSLLLTSDGPRRRLRVDDLFCHAYSRRHRHLHRFIILHTRSTHSNQESQSSASGSATVDGDTTKVMKVKVNDGLRLRGNRTTWEGRITQVGGRWGRRGITVKLATRHGQSKACCLKLGSGTHNLKLPERRPEVEAGAGAVDCERPDVTAIWIWVILLRVAFGLL
jgi:hypothetical protein